jgi:hypothetical protein
MYVERRCGRTADSDMRDVKSTQRNNLRQKAAWPANIKIARNEGVKVLG